MSLSELRKAYEKRRHNLIAVLENPESGLDLSKQHQVYGAVKEIENFLKTIDHLQEVEAGEFKIALDEEMDAGFLNRLQGMLKK